MQSNNPTFAVLVVTCDNYSDLWGPFHQLYHRYWPDCPMRTYILTNHLTPDLPGFTPLPVGPDISWSDNLLKALDRIPEDYVLMFLEDLLLDSPVDTPRLQEVLDWTQEHQPDHVRLNASEAPTSRSHPLVGHIAPGALYRTSTILSLWKKSTLQAILKPGENAWQFELEGSARSDRFPAFYTVYRDCFPVLNGVIKRKWRPSVVRRLVRQGITLDLSRRKVMTPGEAFRLNLAILRSRAFQWIPWRLRRRIRKTLLGS